MCHLRIEDEDLSVEYRETMHLVKSPLEKCPGSTVADWKTRSDINMKLTLFFLLLLPMFGPDTIGEVRMPSDLTFSHYLC